MDKIPTVKYMGNVQEQVKNENDADEQKLNQQLLDLAEATKDLIKIPAFNTIVLNTAKNSGADVVYYSELKIVAPHYYNIINQKLATKNTSVEIITTNMTHAPILPNPDYPETALTEVYQPAIFVPNSSTASTNLQPLISPNVEGVINDEDYILCWYFVLMVFNNKP